MQNIFRIGSESKVEQRIFCEREYCYVGDIEWMMSSGNPLSNQRSYEVWHKKKKREENIRRLGKLSSFIERTSAIVHC